MRFALVLSMAAGLAGCASSDDRTAATERRVTYTCDRGPGMTVVFGQNEARIEGADGQVIVLLQRVSGSGIWYETPTHSLRGKGDEMTYTIGRMAPMQCRAN